MLLLVGEGLQHISDSQEIYEVECSHSAFSILTAAGRFISITTLQQRHCFSIAAAFNAVFKIVRVSIRNSAFQSAFLCPVGLAG